MTHTLARKVLGRGIIFLLFLAAIVGCVANGATPSEGTPTWCSSPVASVTHHPGTQGEAELEVAVLHELEDFGLTSMAVAWHMQCNVVLVTVGSCPGDKKVTKQTLEQVRLRAEQVSNGVPVVVELGGCAVLAGG